jgi:hypothetical protein
MPRLETDWTGVDLRPTQDLFGNVCMPFHSMAGRSKGRARAGRNVAESQKGAEPTICRLDGLVQFNQGA